MKVLEGHVAETVPFAMEVAGMGVGMEQGPEGRCGEKARFEEENDDMWKGMFRGVSLL